MRRKWTKKKIREALARKRRRAARRKARQISRPKLPTLRSLRRKLDHVFSLYIRLRYADGAGVSPCCTCGRLQHYKAANAGHFIKRQFLATRYDERNCHVQCVPCNLYRGGELVEYNAFMLKTYGQVVIDELRLKRHTTVKFGRAELEAMIARFSEIPIQWGLL